MTITFIILVSIIFFPMFQILCTMIITFIILVSMLFYLPVGILAHLSGKNNLFFSFAHLYWFLLKMTLCVWFARVVTDCQQEVRIRCSFSRVKENLFSGII
uniref:Uncharacterized protein n=1 Tax=Cacopsylla melanoneura TaxID=428564 RepID=A0A8D8TYD4_9HEMI